MRVGGHNPRVSRPLKLGLLALAVLLFLLVSAGLARVLSASDAERGQIDLIVEAEARGDAAGIVRAVAGCARSAACRARAEANASALRRPGTPKLLRLDPTTRIVLGDARGTTRVAWTVPGRGRPVVQCFSIHRGGNVVSGMSVAVAGVSRRIPGTALCKGMKEGI